MFQNRYDAGCKLAEELIKYRDENCIILGIPRGGMIIAKCIAERLNKPWDIIVPKKIPSPFNREVAIGALTQDGNCLINRNIVKYYNISDDYINKEIELQLFEIKRRLKQYRGRTDFPQIDGRTVILTDDGVATGYTFLAAINSINRHKINKLVAAIPVAPVEVIDMIGHNVDEVICIESPRNFICVGDSYMDFTMDSESNVSNLFKQQYETKMV